MNHLQDFLQKPYAAKKVSDYLPLIEAMNITNADLDEYADLFYPEVHELAVNTFIDKLNSLKENKDKELHYDFIYFNESTLEEKILNELSKDTNKVLKTYFVMCEIDYMIIEE